MLDNFLASLSDAIGPDAVCRRLSLLSTVKPIPIQSSQVDAARVSVDSKARAQAGGGGGALHDNYSRRASLDVNVEYAVAMVNEDSSLDEDDRFMSPFGNRRDSVCGTVLRKKGPRRILKKQPSPDADSMAN